MGRPPPSATQKWILLFLLMGAWAGEGYRCQHPGVGVTGLRVSSCGPVGACCSLVEWGAILGVGRESNTAWVEFPMGAWLPIRQGMESEYGDV